MSKFDVLDISRKDMLSKEYDLGIFCCGYEPRCTFLSEILDRKRLRKSIVFSYKELSELPHRKSIDSFFINCYTESDIFNTSTMDVRGQFQKLNSWFNDDKMEIKDELNILIDYSSMTKSLLSVCVFFFIRFIQRIKKISVNIDFSYSIGEYPEIKQHSNFSPPLVLQGCEGAPLTYTKKAGVFLLGFDSVGPQVVFNTVNPDESYGVFASPSAKEGYAEAVLAYNSEFIDSQLGGKRKVLGLPLTNVTICFDYLNQIISPLKSECNISIGLFGPKPHILASILTANFHNNVTCLHCKAIDSKPRLVQGIGELVLTRLSFA